MRRRLYPPEKYPRGHRDIAISLRNLAVALQSQERYDEAETSLNEQLQILRELYPASEFPRGHSDFARCLTTIGSLKRARRELAQSLEHFQRALDMRKAFYERDGQVPDHPRISESYNNVAIAHDELGNQEGARNCFEIALAIDRRIFPRATFPFGHPDLARTMTNLGSLCAEMEDYARAKER